MAHFIATDDFTEALAEVDYFIVTASEKEADASAYNALNKAAILLLAAKLEAFCEDLLEEFCFYINQKKLSCDRVPSQIRLNATRKLIREDLTGHLDRNDEAKAIPALETLSHLWYVGAIPAKIVIDCKFTYGKHGEKEIRRLFQRIGIDDIFEFCKVPEDVESYDVTDPLAVSSIVSEVNALIGYRNNIIHNDGTPAVTHVQIGKYRKRLLLFVMAIDGFTAQHVEAII